MALRVLDRSTGMLTAQETRCVVEQGVREQHIASALSRGLPICTRGSERPGKIAIVGSGPSVRDYLDELAAFDGPVWAINGAYDFLRSVGIAPAAFVGLDPQREMLQFFKAPDRATTFFLASCTHPDVFGHLAGYDVRIWHSNSDTVKTLPSGSYAVPGGITCITRAPFLAYLLGWREVHIYGADSSYADQPYAYETGSDRCDPNDRTIRVRVNGQVFRTEAGLMHQAENLGLLEEVFPGKVVFRSGGMLPAFLASTMENVA